MIGKGYTYLAGVFLVSTTMLIASSDPVKKDSETIQKQNCDGLASQYHLRTEVQNTFPLQPVIGPSHILCRVQENVKKDDTILVTGARRGGPFDRARRFYAYNFLPTRQVDVVENQNISQSYPACQNQSYQGRGRGFHGGRGRARGLRGNNTQK